MTQAAEIVTREEAPVSRQLMREIEAANLLRAQITDIAGDDPDFIRDTIEGETNVREILSMLVAMDGEDRALVEGLETFIAGMGNRKDRIKKRIEVRRALIATGLEAAGITKLETPTGTISERKVAPSAIITDEAEIPSGFWKAQPPKLDKKAVTDALKNGQTIPGATLSNGGKTISVSRI